MTSAPRQIWTETESGTVALFEPAQVLFENFYADELFTYQTYFHDGRLLLLSIGGDGSVGVGIEMVNALPPTTGAKLEGRLVVKSGKLFFGPGEALPHEDRKFDESSCRGEWIELPPGRYRYVLVPTTSDNPKGLSFRLFLTQVNSFDGIPYLKGKGDLPFLEG